VNPAWLSARRHETTRLSIEALEEFVKPGSTVLMVGTGSHLAKAARCWAPSESLPAIRYGRRANRGRWLSTFGDAVATASVDVVVANISPEAIVRLAPDLVRVLRKGGVLLASALSWPKWSRSGPRCRPR